MDNAITLGSIRPSRDWKGTEAERAQARRNLAGSDYVTGAAVADELLEILGLDQLPRRSELVASVPESAWDGTPADGDRYAAAVAE
ncbi:hypothetical protein SAMN04515671_2945 [Nakamurella panacisegetis]|uniref:Uncharacterized protein n=1 Tax=Nakamurella panacisegetis TaxID=1090615 RepID=A0A1H0PZ57_9ACTN|nr:hypothetical protein [Nakamurella panacisegetis]SDP10477.1 hypothetical protein SAMN04515671_2945 [Nakamurella panacisegetis]